MFLSLSLSLKSIYKFFFKKKGELGCGEWLLKGSGFLSGVMKMLYNYEDGCTTLNILKPIEVYASLLLLLLSSLLCERTGRRGRETSIGCLLHMPRPVGGHTHNPGSCHDWESNLQHSGLWDDVPAEPHRPGRNCALEMNCVVCELHTHTQAKAPLTFLPTHGGGLSPRRARPPSDCFALSHHTLKKNHAFECEELDTEMEDKGKRARASPENEAGAVV